MNNLKAQFNVETKQVIVFDGDKEVCRIPAGIANWLMAVLPNNESFMEYINSKKLKTEDK